MVATAFGRIFRRVVAAATGLVVRAQAWTVLLGGDVAEVAVVGGPGPKRIGRLIEAVERKLVEQLGPNSEVAPDFERRTGVRPPDLGKNLVVLGFTCRLGSLAVLFLLLACIGAGFWPCRNSEAALASS